MQKKLFMLLFGGFLLFTACTKEETSMATQNTNSGNELAANVVSIQTTIATPEPMPTSTSLSLPITNQNISANQLPVVSSDLCESQIEEVEKTMSEYTTQFSTKNKGRSKNIALAAKAINGAVVEPGAVFSYNKTVGPTNRRRGYKLASIFVKGKEEKGYGGGVCQVSSTLYNAVFDFGLEVVERHDHSLPVTYVPLGQDAATSYGGIDFKFKNNKSYPVIISTNIEKGNLCVRIEKLEM